MPQSPVQPIEEKYDESEMPAPHEIELAGEISVLKRPKGDDGVQGPCIPDGSAAGAKRGPIPIAAPRERSAVSTDPPASRRKFANGPIARSRSRGQGSSPVPSAHSATSRISVDAVDILKGSRVLQKSDVWARQARASGLYAVVVPMPVVTAVLITFVRI